MRKLVLILMVAFSATAINGYAQQSKDKCTSKKDPKCAKMSAGMSCCKKSSSRASLLNAKPATATAATAKPAATVKPASTAKAPVKKAA